MKLFAILLLTACSIHAQGNKDLWAKYNSRHKHAMVDLSLLEEGAMESATPSVVVGELVDLAFIGVALGRKDIAGWGYNNAAYADISAFKALCYWEVTSAVKDQHRRLRKLALANAPLLEEAAVLLGNARRTEYDDPEFLGKVSSNEKFIAYVKKHVLNTP